MSVPKPKHPSSSAARNAVRIVGGQWKRSVITFSDADGLRPTPDRVRETVFNWLGQDLTGMHVLDAFAGTGALALEAASRGAARVVALDTNPTNVRTIATHVERLGGAGVVEVLRADALQYLANACGAGLNPPLVRGEGEAVREERTNASRFDIIFLDPPFTADLYSKLADLAPQVLRENGMLYVEAPEKFDTYGGLVLRKHLKAGMVHAQVFVRDAA
jgi:16S rRNA (guanine966-N2)-methyltransferase